VEIGKTSGPVRKRIAAWARDVGLRGGYSRQKKDSMPWGWTISKSIVFKKVREALGLDRAHYLATAAAPMSLETAEFFLSLDLPICDVYGMSELAGPSTITPPAQLRSGAVGIAVPGIQVKIDNPDKDGNGEICWKGRSSFLGYMHNEKETRETLGVDGWLRTGDIGQLKDGFLYITGRIKELIITAGGENVAPVMIEDDLKLEIGGVVSNIMVVGDKRKFLACLLTFKTQPIQDHVEDQYPFSDALTHDAIAILERLGSTAKTVSEARKDPNLKKWINDGISRYNKRATSNAQQLRAFTFLETDFTIENDTLTPTMKLKRRIVVQKFATEIDEMYIEAEKEFAS